MMFHSQKLIIIIIFYKLIKQIMGELNLVPLFGTNFPRFFPIILIILCLLTLFDFYGRLLSSIGLK